MDKIRIETVAIIVSIMLVFGLAVRADIETDIRFRESRIVNLEAQVKGKAYQIKDLQEQLQPPEYAQPVKKVIVSSGTGVRVNPLGGGTEVLHKGSDMVGKLGDPVDAVLAGRVVEHWLPPGRYGGKWFSGHPIMGGYIVVNHGEFFSLYGHLSKTFVHEGDWIEAGQTIGEMGSTGMSTGVHLHLGVVVPPFKYLAERRR